jgi:hypothetical protein
VLKLKTPGLQLLILCTHSFFPLKFSRDDMVVPVNMRNLDFQNLLQRCMGVEVRPRIRVTYRCTKSSSCNLMQEILTFSRRGLMAMLYKL